MPLFIRRLDKGTDLEWAELDENFSYLDRPSPPLVTISSGIITINGPGLYRVETQGAAPTDDVTGIAGGSGREWPVIFTLNVPGRVITFIHTAPNFLLANGANFFMDSVNDSIEFRDRTSAIWREIRRCSIP